MARARGKDGSRSARAAGHPPVTGTPRCGELEATTPKKIASLGLWPKPLPGDYVFGSRVEEPFEASVEAGKLASKCLGKAVELKQIADTVQEQTTTLDLAIRDPAATASQVASLSAALCTDQLLSLTGSDAEQMAQIADDTAGLMRMGLEGLLDGLAAVQSDDDASEEPETQALEEDMDAAFLEAMRSIEGMALVSKAGPAGGNASEGVDRPTRDHPSKHHKAPSSRGSSRARRTPRETPSPSDHIPRVAGFGIATGSRPSSRGKNDPARSGASSARKRSSATPRKRSKELPGDFPVFLTQSTEARN
mmetsp:Transcript_57879/g.154661  ORF Transcript_57879/g.154661 Transcript_57879/m.154661 type:complete len:307 (+) Transcript_57879:18-938(+)